MKVLLFFECPLISETQFVNTWFYHTWSYLRACTIITISINLELMNHSIGEPGLLRNTLSAHTCCKELTINKDANNVAKNSMTYRRTQK